MSERPGSSVRARVTVLEGSESVVRRDHLATEEPLEIRLAAAEERSRVAVTMRTPGHDFELAVGFLAGEGVIRDQDDLRRVDYCTEIDVPAEQQYNVVTVTLRAAELPELVRLDRHGFVSSACGVCGKASLDALAIRSAPVSSSESITLATLYALPDRLRAAQAVFGDTGGLHAAALFTGDGVPIVVREDVGRHNAVDKVVGHRLLHGGPAPAVLVVSGRTSYEIVQKAVAARVPVVAGVSAPTSLAVAAAEQFGVTLAGFLRGEHVNVYSHPERVASP
ncbi:MAG TPA: formate dehydrogenase accessory sulfurtransferase FdhD [Jatrophihabitantaceae bacterium]|nr:formate dehydrogenase accessory sulfurtransferase FdhD [Jatrophihabitantaceae bacterium]